MGLVAVVEVFALVPVTAVTTVSTVSTVSVTAVPVTTAVVGWIVPVLVTVLLVLCPGILRGGGVGGVNCRSTPS